MKKLKRGLIAAVILCPLCAAAVVCGLLFSVRPAFDSMVYELGQSVSDNPDDYFKGPRFVVEKARVDLSGVDVTRAGEYKAEAVCGVRHFLFDIVIEDTVPPDIEAGENGVLLEAGREYRAKDLVESVEDSDVRTKVYVQSKAELSETVKFDEEGSYSCVVVAEDSSGNRSAAQVMVTADAPPELYGTGNIYIACGSAADYLDGISAWDETDGDLTDMIRTDDSMVCADREGIYPLTYMVEDSDGIETRDSVFVTVADPVRLQKMIGSRSISRDNVIAGAINPYDMGASPEDDIEGTFEDARPALVQLYYEDSRGYSAGSGFIVEITNDNVYICSNRHVVEVNDELDVYFFDGTRANGRVIGYSQDYDVGVAAVAVRDIPESLLEQLLTVHIDETYWKSLGDQRIDVGLERLDREGGISRTEAGTLLNVKQYFPFDEDSPHTEVTFKLEHGDSGSAVLDGHGNLIGMAFAYSVSPRRYWCIPLDEILRCYTRITGREVYVY